MGIPALQLVLRHALNRASDASSQGDAELLRRFAANGDEAAFAALIGRHGPMVWGVCRNLLPADADADDAFQATFLTLLRSVPVVGDRGSLAGWLHRVAYRVGAEIAARKCGDDNASAGPQCRKRAWRWPIPPGTNSSGRSTKR